MNDPTIEFPHVAFDPPQIEQQRLALQEVCSVLREANFTRPAVAGTEHIAAANADVAGPTLAN